MAEAEKSHQGLSRRELLRRAIEAGLGVTAVGAIADIVLNSKNNDTNNTPGVVSPSTPKPQEMDIAQASPAANSTDASVSTPSPFATDMATAIQTAQTPVSTLTTTNTSTSPQPDVPTPTDIGTPESTQTPVLTPEQLVEQGEPYPLHAKHTYTKEAGQLEFLNSITIAMDDKLFDRTGGAISDVSLTDKIPNPQKNLETAILYAYKNALRSQDPTQYGDLTLDQLQEMIKAKKTPKLVLPHAQEGKDLKLKDNVEVDLVNKPIFINFIGGIYGDNLMLDTIGSGINGFRSVDGGLVIECFRQDLYVGKDSPNVTNYNLDNQFETALVMLAYYDFQKNYTDPNYKRTDMYVKTETKYDSEAIFKLLTPKIVPGDIPDSIFLFSAS